MKHILVVLFLIQVTLFAKEEYKWIQNEKGECSIFSNVQENEDLKMFWTGKCKNKKASGVGIAVFYKQNIKKDSIYMYEGKTKNGKFEKDVIISKNGYVHVGLVTFKNGKKNGYALYPRKNGLSEGLYKNNVYIEKKLLKKNTLLYKKLKNKIKKKMFFYKAFGSIHEEKEITLESCKYTEHHFIASDQIRKRPSFLYYPLIRCYSKNNSASNAVKILEENIINKGKKHRNSTIAYAYYKNKNYKKSFEYLEKAVIYDGSSKIEHIQILKDKVFNKFKNKKKVTKELSLKFTKNLLNYKEYTDAFESCKIGKTCNEFGSSNPLNFKLFSLAKKNIAESLKFANNELKNDPSLKESILFPPEIEESIINKKIDLSNYPYINKYFSSPEKTIDDYLVRIFFTYKTKNYKEITMGSGVLISPKHILTNDHVIANYKDYNKNIRTKLKDINISSIHMNKTNVKKIKYDEINKTPYKIAKIIKASPLRDLAIIELNKEIKINTYPELFLDIYPNYGKLISMGYPSIKDKKQYLNMVPTITEGKSSMSRLIFDHRDKKYLKNKRTFIFANSTLTAKGMSGGPVVNSCNQLISLNTAGTILNFKKLTSGSFGALPHDIELLLKNNKIPFKKAIKPCMPFGTSSQSKIEANTVALKYTTKEQSTGLILGDYNTPSGEKMYILVTIAREGLKDKDDVLINSRPGYFKEKLKIDLIDKETSIMIILTKSTKFRRLVHSLKSKYLKIDLPLLIKEDININSTVFLNTTIKTGSFKSRLANTEYNVLSQQELTEIENIKIKKNYIEIFSPIINSNSLGAGLFDGNGALIGIIFHVDEENNKAKAMPSYKLRKILKKLRIPVSSKK